MNKIVGWTDRIKYKKDFMFYIRPETRPNMQDGVFCIEHKTTCTRSFKKVAIIHQTPFFIDMFSDFESFYLWVRKCIHNAELHESDEHILIDGEMTFDPHAEPKRTVEKPDLTKYFNFKEAAL